MKWFKASFILPTKSDAFYILGVDDEKALLNPASPTLAQFWPGPFKQLTTARYGGVRACAMESNRTEL